MKHLWLSINFQTPSEGSVQLADNRFMFGHSNKFSPRSDRACSEKILKKSPGAAWQSNILGKVAKGKASYLLRWTLVETGSNSTMEILRAAVNMQQTNNKKNLSMAIVPLKSKPLLDWIVTAWKQLCIKECQWTPMNWNESGPKGFHIFTSSFCCYSFCLQLIYNFW